ncbi:MAG: hypothetical protein HY747_00200 [Elusimicrobia bacterium]|nr:hypothetical protein [Elusimicrobiota bacterium]
MNYGNKKELIEFLKELDRRLQELRPGRKTSIYVFGGAAVVIGYGAPRATEDLDVYIEETEIEKKLLEWGGPDSDLCRKHNLYLQKANATFMPIEEPDWKDRAKEVLKGALKNLKVMVLGKTDLILSKLGRFNSRDQGDIQYLLKKFKVDPQRLISDYKSARSYYVGNLKELDAAFNIVLKEHFDSGPLSFE